MMMVTVWFNYKTWRVILNTTEKLEEETSSNEVKFVKDFFSSTEFRTGFGRDNISWKFTENLTSPEVIQPVNTNRGGFYLQLPPMSSTTDRTKRYKDFCSMLRRAVDQLEKDLLAADKKAYAHNQKVWDNWKKEQEDKR